MIVRVLIVKIYWLYCFGWNMLLSIFQFSKQYIHSFHHLKVCLSLVFAIIFNQYLLVTLATYLFHFCFELLLLIFRIKSITTVNFYIFFIASNIFPTRNASHWTWPSSRLTETARLLRNVRNVFSRRSNTRVNMELELSRKLLFYLCLLWS